MRRSTQVKRSDILDGTAHRCSSLNKISSTFSRNSRVVKLSSTERGLKEANSGGEISKLLVTPPRRRKTPENKACHFKDKEPILNSDRRLHNECNTMLRDTYNLPPTSTSENYRQQWSEPTIIKDSLKRDCDKCNTINRRRRHHSKTNREPPNTVSNGKIMLNESVELRNIIANLQLELEEQVKERARAENESFKFEQILRQCIAQQSISIASLNYEMAELKKKYELEIEKLRRELVAEEAHMDAYLGLAATTRQFLYTGAQASLSSWKHGLLS